MGESRKILIVDDSLSAAAAIRQMLVAEYRVRVSRDGKNALNLFPRFAPHIVLLDVEMPGMDGYQVCRELRTRDADGSVKIIMLSVKTALEERLRGYEVGADDYLAKPFKEKELLAKIRAFLRIQSLEAELRHLNKELNRQVQVRTAQLVDAEKMAAIGRHAAGTVHNLNNPLQSVLWLTENLTDRHPEDKDIQVLRETVGDMKRIVATILDSASEGYAENVKPIDINEVLKAQVELSKANLFFKNTVQLKMALNPLPPVQGVYAHFSQSFGNLIKNAIDAMHESRHRTLTIESERVGSEILVHISDTGPDIPEDRMDRIFDPFFTTKPLSAAGDRPTGTGLGLAYTREMIESYGGRVELTSAMGIGSMFTVRLPIR